MKKALPLIIVALLIFLSSCEWKEYSSDYSDLYTVALNNVLWTKGWSGGACYVMIRKSRRLTKIIMVV